MAVVEKEMTALVYWWPPQNQADAWRVALRNQGLVVQVMNPSYFALPQQCSFTFDDLHQIGMMALKRAAELFNPSLGWQWSTYACTSIRRRIWSAIKGDTGMRRKVQGILVSLDEMAPNHGFRGEGLNGSTEQDSQEGDYYTSEDVDDFSDDVDDRLLIAELVRGLAPDEKRVIVARYFDDQTFRAIAEDIGCSEFRAINIYKKAIRHMRERCTDAG